MEKISYLPTEKEVRLFFEDLLGKKIKVEFSASPYPYPFSQLTLVGSLIDSTSLEIKVLLFCDLPFAAFSGCALAMIPAAVAKETITEKQVTANVLDNVREIYNILSSLCNQPQHPHLKLKEVLSSEALSEELTQILSKKALKEAHFDVDIASYGLGRLSFLAY